MQGLEESDHWDDGSRIEQKSGWRSVGIAALVLGAFLGGWFYSGDDVPDYPGLPSIADASCRRLWVKHAQNDPALLCYLTAAPSRLCDSAEKQSLLAVISLYRSHANSFNSDLQTAYNGPRWAALSRPREFIAAMREAVAISAGDGDGTFSSMAHDSNGNVITNFSKEEPQGQAIKTLDDHFAEDAKRLKPPTLDAAMKVGRVPYGQLIDALRQLQKQGYLSESDFGWFPDSLVSDALNGNPKAKSPCGSAG